MIDIVKKILLDNKINEEYVEMMTSGLANRIFATEKYIIRIPTDHEEALNDSRTESVAAPVVKKFGINTPQLIRYDNSCKLLDRSYSIWERIHGKTLGQIEDKLKIDKVWKQLGYELGILHTRVTECSDPNSWLDSPDRDYTKKKFLNYFNDGDIYTEKIKKIINNIFNKNTFNYTKCFVHGDTHDENIMCNENNEFSALIDWGDSGWADPAIDFYMVPFQTIGIVLYGYKHIAAHIIDENFLNRIILDKIWCFIEDGIQSKLIYEKIKWMKEEIERNLTTAST